MPMRGRRCGRRSLSWPPPLDENDRRLKSSSPMPALLLIALTLLAYLPVLRGGFIWDDDDYVTNNGNLRSLSGLRGVWLVPRGSPQYYPLVTPSFWFGQRLWGLKPPG